MYKTKFKNLKKFIIYPILITFVNLILVKIAFKCFISNVDIDLDAVLLDNSPRFEKNIGNIFTEESKNENQAVKISDLQFPKTNEEYGKFEIDSLKISASLIFGDDPSVLKQGIGQFNGSCIPGYGGTILTTGHNYMFPEIDKIQTGDIIQITTSYGLYKYRVSDIKILDKSEYQKIKIKDDKEQLIYYTCYPFTSLSDASSRYFVFADYISGPPILK